MSDGSADYQAALWNLEAALKTSIRSFAEWFEREWQYKGRDEWEKTFQEPYPGDEYIEGHNAGVSSALVAMESFINEQGY